MVAVAALVLEAEVAEASLEWVLLVDLVALDMSALCVTINTKVVRVHVVAQKCNVLISD